MELKGYDTVATDYALVTHSRGQYDWYALALKGPGKKPRRIWDGRGEQGMHAVVDLLRKAAGLTVGRQWHVPDRPCSVTELHKREPAGIEVVTKWPGQAEPAAAADRGRHDALARHDVSQAAPAAERVVRQESTHTWG